MYLCPEMNRRREYTDDAPNLEKSKLFEKEWFDDYVCPEEWHPFRLNINIIGNNNGIPLDRWWQHPRYRANNYANKQYKIYIK